MATCGTVVDGLAEHEVSVQSLACICVAAVQVTLGIDGMRSSASQVCIRGWGGNPINASQQWAAQWLA